MSGRFLKFSEVLCFNYCQTCCCNFCICCSCGGGGRNFRLWSNMDKWRRILTAVGIWFLADGFLGTLGMISVIISGNIAALPHIFFASILRVGIGIASLLTAYKPSKPRFIILFILASIWVIMALMLSILHFFVRKSAEEAIVANCLKQSSSITLEQCERIVSAFHILNVVLPILTIIGPFFLFLCISGASLRYHAGSQHEQLLSNDEMNGEILPADRIEMEILDRELGIRVDVQEPEQDANEEQVVEK